MYVFTRWAAHDRSGKICWLLNELNLPYEIEELEYKTAHDDPSYRQLHPLGQVPILRDLRDHVTLFESGAICLYLAEKHASKILPEGQRPLVLQWLFYNHATLEPAIDSYWQITDDDPQLAELKAAIDKKLEVLLAPLESALGRTEFIAGEQLTVADICLGQSLYWLRNRNLLPKFPRTQGYLEKLKARPAAVQAKLFDIPQD